MRRHSQRVGRAALLSTVAIALGLGPSGAASAQGMGALWWQPPQRIGAPGQSLGRISCPSPSLCVVTAGSNGYLTGVATSVRPSGGASAWRFHRVDFDTINNRAGEPVQAQLSDITCPSVRLCAAVDTTGHVLTTSHAATEAGPWSSTKIGGVPELYSLNCASDSLCVAPGESGVAAISTNPAGGSGAWRTVTIDTSPCPAPGCVSYGSGPSGAPVVQAISCPSASLCVAGDLTGHLLATRDPAQDYGPWPIAFVDRNQVICLHTGCPTPIANVVCPSTTLCLAVDDGGDVLRSDDPTAASSWRQSSVLARDPAYGNPGRQGLACPSPSRCVLLDGEHALVSDDPGGGGRWSAAKIDPGGALIDLSCPSPSLCIAIDSLGRVIVGRAGPTRGQISALLRAQMTPRGEAARIGAVLRRGGLELALAAPVPGRIRVDWLASSAGGRSRAVLVAAGAGSFATPKRAVVRLRLTEAGRTLLRRHPRLRLIVRASFTPAASPRITITQAIRLRD